MKNNKLIILVVICLFLQAILFMAFDFPFKTLPILDGFPVGLATPVVTRLLLYWYLPIIAFSFYISGNLKDLLSSYGFLQISRNYKRILANEAIFKTVNKSYSFYQFTTRFNFYIHALFYIFYCSFFILNTWIFHYAIYYF